jgi:excisionase family DNA binding protein
MNAATSLAVTLTVEELRALVREAVREEVAAAGQGASDVLTLPEAAKELRMCGKMVIRFVRTRGLPGVKVGRSWRFRRSQLLTWMASESATSAPSKLRALKGGA